MRGITSWAILILSMVVPVGVAAETGSACAINTIDTSLIAPGHAPVMLSDVSVRLDPSEAITSLTVENTGTDTLNRVFALIEFSKGDKYLFTSLFWGATIDSESKDGLPVPTSYLVTAQRLISTLLPRNRVSLGGINFLRPLECPDTAKLTMFQGTFSQGSPLFLKAMHWRMDPSISNVSEWNMTGAPRNSEALVQLTVDANGKPHLISTQRTDATAWLAGQIEDHWSFLPAIYDGKPISLELWVFFRFFPDHPERSLIESIKGGGRLTAVAFVNILHEKGNLGYRMHYMGDAVSLKMHP